MSLVIRLLEDPSLSQTRDTWKRLTTGVVNWQFDHILWTNHRAMLFYAEDPAVEGDGVYVTATPVAEELSVAYGVYRHRAETITDAMFHPVRGTEVATLQDAFTWLWRWVPHVMTSLTESVLLSNPRRVGQQALTVPPPPRPVDFHGEPYGAASPHPTGDAWETILAASPEIAMWQDVSRNLRAGHFCFVKLVGGESAYLQIMTGTQPATAVRRQYKITASYGVQTAAGEMRLLDRCETHTWEEAIGWLWENAKVATATLRRDLPLASVIFGRAW